MPERPWRRIGEQDTTCPAPEDAPAFRAEAARGPITRSGRRVPQREPTERGSPGTRTPARGCSRRLRLGSPRTGSDQSVLPSRGGRHAPPQGTGCHAVSAKGKRQKRTIKARRGVCCALPRLWPSAEQASAERVNVSAPQGLGRGRGRRISSVKHGDLSR